MHNVVIHILAHWDSPLAAAYPTLSLRDRAIYTTLHKTLQKTLDKTLDKTLHKTRQMTLHKTRQKTRQQASRPVYSTDKGRLCPDCGVVRADCRCKLAHASTGATDGIVRIRRESKGRGGKSVTVVSGLPGSAKELKETAKRLKQRCGVGGSVKDQDIEIQGDQRELIKSLLETQGYSVKLSGG
ncbi:MAG: hypothetical protein Cons2KO_17460 [Congregibacter sp.]